MVPRGQVVERGAYFRSVIPCIRPSLGKQKALPQQDESGGLSDYAGFDYDHARVVRLVLARTFLTALATRSTGPGTGSRSRRETVLADGNMTARTRCVHRVEEVPQAAMLSPEPPGMKLDEPASRVLGTAIENPAVPYQSSLLNLSLIHI